LSGFAQKNHECFVDKGHKAYVMWITVFCPIVITTHPDTAKQMMRSTEPKGNSKISGYKFLRPWLGEYKNNKAFRKTIMVTVLCNEIIH